MLTQFLDGTQMTMTGGGTYQNLTPIIQETGYHETQLRSPNMGPGMTQVLGMANQSHERTSFFDPKIQIETIQIGYYQH